VAGNFARVRNASDHWIQEYEYVAETNPSPLYTSSCPFTKVYPFSKELTEWYIFLALQEGFVG